MPVSSLTERHGRQKRAVSLAAPRGGDRAGIFIFLSLRDLTRSMFLVCMWRSAARASSVYEWRDLLSVRRDLLSVSLSSAANSREEN